MLYNFSDKQVENIKTMADVALKQMGINAIGGIQEILVILANPLDENGKAIPAAPVSEVKKEEKKEEEKKSK